jgi:hypothetical protein
MMIKGLGNAVLLEAKIASVLGPWTDAKDSYIL